MQIAMHAALSVGKTSLQGTDRVMYLVYADTALLLLRQYHSVHRRLPTPAHLHLHQRSAHYQEHALPDWGQPLRPLGPGTPILLRTPPCEWLGWQGHCMLLCASVHTALEIPSSQEMLARPQSGYIVAQRLLLSLRLGETG